MNTSNIPENLRIYHPNISSIRAIYFCDVSLPFNRKTHRISLQTVFHINPTVPRIWKHTRHTELSKSDIMYDRIGQPDASCWLLG